jgi:thiosulfate dehydrogenase
MKTGLLLALLFSSLSACQSAPAAQTEIAYGKALIVNTARYLGPEATPPELRLTRSQMACSACHLNAGTHPQAIGFTGIGSRYPRWRALENREITLAERINSCLERSLNARPLPAESRELKALEAYLRSLKTETPPTLAGDQLQLPEIERPRRAADPRAGQQLYTYHCAACHGSDGAGRLKTGGGYIFPPVWGEFSYGQGSNLNRLTVLARYLKANMPLGRPVLSSSEAFDLAAYLNSQPRPALVHPEQDYPDRTKKPVDVAYPPFGDNLPAERHRLGPFTDAVPGTVPPANP